jgi:hypothetical protein
MAQTELALIDEHWQELVYRPGTRFYGLRRVYTPQIYF